jgi:hypothetical protein
LEVGNSNAYRRHGIERRQSIQHRELDARSIIKVREFDSEMDMIRETATKEEENGCSAWGETITCQVLIRDIH